MTKPARRLALYAAVALLSIGYLTPSSGAAVRPSNRLAEAPVIAEGESVSVTIDEDNSPTAFELTLNASDADGDTLTWSIAVPASHGTASAAGTGTSKIISYTPSENYNGEDSFVVSVSDGVDGIDSVTVNVTVQARNDAPVNTVLPSIAGTVHTGDMVTAQAGSWNDDADIQPGTLTYSYQWQRADDVAGTNAADIAGAIASTYTVTPADGGKFLRVRVVATDDGEGLPASMSTQAVSAWIPSVNAAPAITEGAGPLSMTIDEDNSPTAFTLTLHASDADGDTLTWSIAVPASHGTATTAGTGTSKVISYTPALDYNSAFGGAESFVVQVDDGNGGTDTITVDVTVRAVNDAPVNIVPVAQSVDSGADLVFSTAAGTAVAVSDADVDEMAPPSNTVQVTLSAEHGTLTLGRTTGLTFTAGANGTASMTIRANMVNVNGAMDGLRYRSDAGYSGADSLTVLTSDLGNTGSGGILTDTDAVGITVVDETAPSVVSVTSDTPDGLYGEGRSINIQINFSEAVVVTGIPIISLETGPSDAIAIYAGGSGSSVLSFLYTPSYPEMTSDLDYAGTGALSLNLGTIRDGAGNNAVLILPVPGAAGSLGANKDIAIDAIYPYPPTVSGPASTTDTTPTWTWTPGGEGNGTFRYKLDSSNLTVGATETTDLSFTPETELAEGSHWLFVQERDAAGNWSQSSQFETVVIINEAPVIAEGDGPVALTIDEDNSPTAFELTLNASDADGDTLTWSIAVPASHGTATTAGTGTSKVISYTPALDYNSAFGGAESFVVQVDDGNGGTDTITVDVTVRAVNDAPVNIVPVAQSVDSGADLVFSTAAGTAFAVSDADVDEMAPPSNTVQVTLSAEHGTLTLGRTTGLTFTAGANETASMTIRANLVNINGAMDGLRYRGEAGYSGVDSVTILTSDLGNTGSGGILTDADAVGVTVVDTIPPAAPNAPDLEAASDTGTSSADNITDDTTPTFVITGVEALATVRLICTPIGGGAQVLETATVGEGQSSCAITIAAGLGVGAYVAQATQMDAAGNVSAVSSPMTPALTIAVAPAVATQAATDISSLAAVGHGDLTALGTPGATAHGLVWNTAGAPTLADNSTNLGYPSTPGFFASPLAGLSPNTSYYVRAYATSALATVYGDQVAFTTLQVHSLTYAAGEGGSLTGAVSQTVDHGGSGTTVTAVPDEGYHFVDWSDGVPTAERTDTNVTADISVIANFALNTYTLTIFKAGTGNGTVLSTPSGISCGATCVGSFAHGTVVSLSAVPSATSSFDGWSGAFTGTDNPLSLTMDGPKTLQATFTRIMHTISGTVTAGGAGIPGVAMNGLPGSPLTDINGFYSVAVEHLSAYTITPYHAYYTFEPTSRTYISIESDQTGQDYDASLITTVQRQALIAFYNSTNGDGWYAQQGWKSAPLYPDGFAMPGTESSWFGLTVDPESGLVTGIELVDDYLHGAIPPEIGNLTSLRRLILNDNHFIVGPLPAALGDLSALEELRLRNNQIDGAIPAELGNMSGLRIIDLDMNRLSGSIPASLGAMANLQSLSMASNQLTGTIPPELGNSPALTDLVLDSNQLTGAIPAELGSLGTLVRLDLGMNQLSGPIPPELGDLTNLQYLLLHRNHLDGTLPAALGGLTQLVQLYISGNMISGPIPPALTDLTALAPGASSFWWNALYTSDEEVLAFMNAKDETWAATQTIAPEQVIATSLDNAVVLVSWLPIAYTGQTGLYKVLISETPGGPYTLAGQTADKTTSSVQVTGLTPGTRYYFVVQTQTDPHESNPNTVVSENSAEATAIAWLQTLVQISGSVAVGGAPLAGVVMSGLPEGTVTDASGAYSGMVDVDWSGTVAPVLAGYTFSPASLAYSHLTADQVAQDYTATLLTYTVSGTVTVGGSPLAGVTMAGLPGNPVTDASGTYSATVDYGFSGTVTPTLQYYTFDPGSKAYTDVASDLAGQDYAATLISSTQRQALIAFYNSTNGDGWTYKTGWKNSPLYPDGFAMPGTEGTWYGVTASGGNITALNLPVNNLTGSLPAALGDLVFLTSLNLRSNAITGAIPAGIGNLVNLTVLSLNQNQFSGSLPAEIGSLTQLVSLNLYVNQFSGPLPSSLGNLASLQSLSAYSNLFDGSIPPELGNLSRLMSLDLHSNQLSGDLPAELGNLTALEFLLLQVNQLTGPFPAEWGNMSSLTFFRCEDNQISGSIPASFGNLSQLTNFTAGYNSLSGPIPAELGDLSELVVLDLRHNGLTGTIPISLSQLSSIQVLYLQFNHLTGPIPAEFGLLTTLTDLRLQSNELTGPIPVELGNLTNLQTLYIHLNQLSGPIPVVLGSIPGLRSLHLYSNQLTGTIPPELGALTELFDLSLYDNSLEGQIPSELGNLTQLQIFTVNGNKLSGPIPPALANLTALVPASTNFGYNALYATDEDLIAFLNVKDPDWVATQTVAPSQVTATSLDNAAVLVSWLPIAYTGATGYYRVLSAQTPGGPYTAVGQTTSKTVSSLLVSGLAPGTRYYFVVQTHTDAHAGNQNALDSEYSAEVSATAWLQVHIQMSGTIAAGGQPLAGVIMNGLPIGTATNASGGYAATLDAGWTGTVTPELAGYAFTPASRAYAGLTTDQAGQDFTARLLAPSITVSSPNGGETWAPSSGQTILWAAVDVFGTVTIDLYKGGVYFRTLGTADAATGTFAWTLAANEELGTDYRILIWQSGVSDDSDGDFSIAATIRKDDLVGSWDGQGVYYRNSDTAGWVRMASPATMIRTGDLDGDGVDDLIGIWPSQGGVWAKYSANGLWARLSSTARYIGSGDMNGDGCDDLLGTWDDQGVFYRDSATGAWVRLASPATMVASGDLDGDGTDDLIGLWPAQGGIWVKYSASGSWSKISSTAVHIAAGDMDGDGRDDLLGTWDGQGVYYRNSMTGAWVRMASPATLIAAGDIDGDGTDDLIGIWPTQGGVWVKYSASAAWQLLGSTPADIAAGKMRPVELPAAAAAAMTPETIGQEAADVEGSFLPVGGTANGPFIGGAVRDAASEGPGGVRFVFLDGKNLVPREDASRAGAREPGPGEPHFRSTEQANPVPSRPVKENRPGKAGETLAER